MKLGVAHELGLACALTSALLLVLLGGELPGFAWGVLLAPWIGALLQLRGVFVPALSGTLVGLGGVALAATTFAQGGAETAVLALTELVLGLLTGRVLTRRLPRHDIQAIGLSVLLVLAASVLNVTLSFMPLFVMYAVCAVWALATRQLLAGAVAVGDDDGRARARVDVVTPAFFVGTAATALAVLVTAGALFLAFPRVGIGDIGGFVRRQDKLPSVVGLRGDPRALGGTTVVARIDGVPRAAWERALYLRGVVYDVVALDGFSQSDERVVSRAPNVRLADDEPRNARYTVTASPAMGNRVLVLGSVRVARTLSGGAMNAAALVPIAGRTNLDEIHTREVIDAPLRYEVLGGIAHAGEPEVSPRDAVAPAADDDALIARYRALPPGFDTELTALAERIAPTGPPLEQAASLRAFLLREFRYGLDPPRFADRPLRAFLLDDRRGHCEFFAAGFALLLRSRGIAARVVGGYQGGAWDDGVVVFQDKHAHAWVEWYLPDVGWVVDDATPMPSAPREVMQGVDTLVERVRRFWDDRIIDFAFDDQLAGLAQLRRSGQFFTLRNAALIGGAAAGVAALAWMLRHRPRRRARALDGAPLGHAITSCVARLTRAPVRPAATVREAVAQVPPSHSARALLDTALADYERSRFAGEPLPASVRDAHIRALRRAPDRRESAR